MQDTSYTRPPVHTQSHRDAVAAAVGNVHVNPGFRGRYPRCQA